MPPADATRRYLVAPALLALLALLAACSRPAGSPVGGPAAPGGAPAGFSLTAFDVHAAAPVAPEAAERAKAGVLATLDAYLQRAVLGPLSPGGAVGDLGPVLTAAAAARLSGPDRAALVEEVAAGDGTPSVDVATATIGLLVDPGGRPVMAGVHVALRVRAGTGKDQLLVERQGDLALVAEGDPANPVWKVDSYDMKAARGPAAATAAAEGGTP